MSGVQNEMVILAHLVSLLDNVAVGACWALFLWGVMCFVELSFVAVWQSGWVTDLCGSASHGVEGYGFLREH